MNANEKVATSRARLARETGIAKATAADQLDHVVNQIIS